MPTFRDSPKLWKVEKNWELRLPKKKEKKNVYGSLSLWVSLFLNHTSKAVLRAGTGVRRCSSNNFFFFCLPKMGHCFSMGLARRRPGTGFVPNPGSSPQPTPTPLLSSGTRESLLRATLRRWGGSSTQQPQPALCFFVLLALYLGSAIRISNSCGKMQFLPLDQSQQILPIGCGERANPSTLAVFVEDRAQRYTEYK